jgi:hypothetical protein
VDAVIAALQVALREAEMRTNATWLKAAILNRWIGRLPGAWWGRWRELKMTGDFTGGSDIGLVPHAIHSGGP